MERKNYVLTVVGLGFAMMLSGCTGSPNTESIEPTTSAVVSTTEQQESGYVTKNVELEYLAQIINDCSLLGSPDSTTSSASLTKDIYVTVTGEVYFDDVLTSWYAVRTEDNVSGYLSAENLNFNVEQETDALANIEAYPDEESITEATEEVVQEEPVQVVEETPVVEEAQPVVESYGVTACEPTVKYANTNLNVRAIPSKDGELVGTATTNTEITVVGTTEDGWSQVEYNGLVSYIKSSLLSDSKVEVKATKSNNNSSSSQGSSSTAESSSSNTADTSSSSGGSEPSAEDLSALFGNSGEVTIGAGGSNDGYTGDRDLSNVVVY